jgi:hypothetical protein
MWRQYFSIRKTVSEEKSTLESVRKKTASRQAAWRIQRPSRPTLGVHASSGRYTFVCARIAIPCAGVLPPRARVWWGGVFDSRR